MAIFPFRFGPGECCCGGCWTFADNFDRTASTNLGADWNEVTGNWEILTYRTVGVLHEQYGVAPGAGGTASAKVFCTREIVERTIDGDTIEGEMYITVDVVDPQVNDRYYVYPCCDSTSVIGDVTVEFKYTATGTWLITIGAHTLTTTGTPDPTTGVVHLGVCADHTTQQVSACVGILGIAPTLWADDDPGPGHYAALGHNNASTGAIFDSFEMGELRTETEICRSCFCACGDVTLPVELHGSFQYTSPTGKTRVSCLEDVTWTMTRVGGTTSPIWSGEVEITTVETPPVVQTVRFTLLCTGIWQLDIVVLEGGIEVSPDCFSSTYYYSDATSVAARWEDDADPSPAYYSTCDPLALVYGPWDPDVRDDCNWCYKMSRPLDCIIGGPPADPALCAGEFWIVITE